MKMNEKRFLLLMTCFLLLSARSTTPAQMITNVHQQTQDGRIVVMFDLEGASSYDISIVALDGAGRKVTPSVVTGDLRDVPGGSGKAIWWEPQLEGKPLTEWKMLLRATITLGVQWIPVEGGTFQMGSPENRIERPVHAVSLRGFLMSATEITFAQYDRYCDAAHIDKPYDNGWGRGGRPVINVSWSEAKAYCEWASRTTGTKVRLPTEAEWEYAARGGTRSSGFIYAGADSPDDVAWYSSNAGGSTHPAGQKKANELGLYDMSGNVWEYCADWYAWYPEENGPLENPTGPENGEWHVLRGGSWDYSVSGCRVAERYHLSAGFHDVYYGFRCVQEVSP